MIAALGAHKGMMRGGGSTSGAPCSKKAGYSPTKEQMIIKSQGRGKIPASTQRVANIAAAPPLPKRKKTNTAPSPRSEAAPLPVSLPPGVFAVETIVGIKVSGERLMYLVKWAWYDASSNSWEPEKNILDPALLAAFQRTHSAAHQAAMAAIAKAKHAKTAASVATHD
jgi:hypothetical protein